MASPDEDYASAALRHLRDAEHLASSATSPSPDQAWHLAGFAHECARKACLKDGWVPRLLGHDFTDASERVIEWAAALDPRAGRFPVARWAERFPAIACWDPQHRYARTGTTAKKAERDLRALLDQGREAVDGSLAALFALGQLDEESLQ